MRTAKVLGTLVVSVIAVIVVVLASVWLFVNPNHYKPKVIAAVKAATGRDLVLEGDLKLSLLPWIALELGPASLSNPPGFVGPQFVTFQHATVRVRLWPLLRERLEISHVDLDGLSVNLQKDATGRGNWHAFGRTADEGTQDAVAAPGAAVPAAGFPALKISQATVTYRNLRALNLTLETGPSVDGMVPISIHCDADRGVTGEQASVEVKLALGMPAVERYRLAAVSVAGQLTRAGNNRPIRWTLATPGVDLDFATETLAAPELALRIAGADLTGSVQGTEILKDLHLAGAATLSPLVLREFLPRWGLASPHTSDPKGLAQLSATTTFAFGGNLLRFDHVRATLDATHIAGSMAITNLATRSVTFALTADAIDANRYLAPNNAAQGDTAPGDAAATSPPQKPAQPVAATGTLAIGSLTLGAIDLTDVRLTLEAKDGVTRIYPATALVDGGNYSGDISWDRRGSTPVLSLDEHWSGADLEKLFTGKPTQVHLSGKANVNLKATARGGSAAFLETLNGHLDVDVTDGALEGIDLGYQMGRAEALIERTGSPLVNSHRTRFDTLRASAEITNGTAATTDLMIASPGLKVSGEGTANLAAQTLDLHLLADTLKSLQGVPVLIPVTVTGHFSDPTVRPDVEAFAKGQLKQKLKDVLRDKLQSLFGRP
jgi:AsmA protein